MGTFVKPYVRLRQLPKEHGVCPLISNGVSHVIGMETFDHDSLKITTIPMKLYIAKDLVKVVDAKLYLLVGDAGCGLIFIEGANNAIVMSAFWAEGLWKHCFEKKLTTPKKISQMEFRSISKSLLNASLSIRKRYKEAEERIEIKTSSIRIGETVGRTMASTLKCSRILDDDDETISDDEEFSKHNKKLDVRLNKFAVDKRFLSCIHLFDEYANDLDHEIALSGIGKAYTS